MATGTQRTEGGGDPRPIRGTFSYRGFPPNRAVWFLRESKRSDSKAVALLESPLALNIITLTYMYSDMGALETAGAGGCRLL